MSTEVHAGLCRIRRFCAAAGRKRHRHVQAAAHHRPLHLLHRSQWVHTDLSLPSSLHTHHCSSQVLIFSLLSPAAHMKIACDNTVVRMVSSGKFVNRVSFSYRLLDSQELQTIRLNNVEDFCFSNWPRQDHNGTYVIVWLQIFLKFILLKTTKIHLSLSPWLMKCLQFKDNNKRWQLRCIRSQRNYNIQSPVLTYLFLFFSILFHFVYCSLKLNEVSFCVWWNYFCFPYFCFL